MRGSISSNMYITLANMMMRFLVAVVFNFIITYLVLPDNVYKKITEQVDPSIRKS